MRRELQVLLLADALIVLAGGMFGPIYAVFVEEIGGDLLIAGSAYSIFTISTGVGMFLLSRWKFYGEHKAGFVILGYGLACAGFWGYLNVTNPAQLFLVQLIFGLGEAIGTPAWDGLYSWLIKADHFVLRWGEYDAMYNIVIGIAAMVGGWLASLYGFRFLFTVMFTFSLAGLLTSTCLVLGKR